MNRMRFIRLISGVLSLMIALTEAGPAGDLRDTSLQADYVVVSPSSYCALAETLAAFHRRQDGLRTLVVCMDTVAAQFGQNAAPDTALRAFLRYALTRWTRPAPRYFVLGGNTNTVPSHPKAETLLETGCDTVLMIDRWLAESPDGSGGPMTCIARLPAEDSVAFAVMVRKIIAYEQTDAGQTWCGRAISLADYNPADGRMFEYDAMYFQTLLHKAWADTIAVDIRGDSPSHLQSDSFVRLWNEGASIITYCGHANARSLSATHYFTCETVDSLRNGERLPVCLLGGCDLCYEPGACCPIPTRLLSRGGGGAVAVISSVGLIYECDVVSFLGSLIQSLVGDPGKPLGLAFEDAQRIAGEGIAERLTLLGDPAMHVKRAPNGATAVPNLPASATFWLAQNFPNPFNPVTTIRYRIPHSGHVRLTVYDVLGREVRIPVDGTLEAGEHAVVVDASGLPSGSYFYRLQSGGRTETRKFVVLH